MAPSSIIDKTSAVIQSHVQALEAEQAAIIAKVGNNIRQLYSYRYAMNGFAAVMTPAQANKFEHFPSLQDTRPVDRPSACESVWAEVSLLGMWLCKNFSRADDIIDFEDLPEGWNGTCEIGEDFTEDDCNNKMIGARTFIEGARATGPIDSGEIISARDVDGHRSTRRPQYEWPRPSLPRASRRRLRGSAAW